MDHDQSNYDQHMSRRFSAPVPRELVHRRAISEVFLTDIYKTGNETYILSAQWPRWHVFYGSVKHGYDSALVVETLRQLTVLIAHTQLQVPLDMTFLMPDISVSMTSGTIQNTFQPVEVTAEVRVSEIMSTGRGVMAFRTNAIFLVDGQKIASGTAGARIVDPEAYNRIRSRRATPAGRRIASPVSAVEVGHSSPWNVVLGESSEAGSWPLRVDVSNPILFDHPLDHVPGVLLIEAVRQAVRLTFLDPSLDFASLEARFVSIADLGDEAVVVLESVAVVAETITVMATVRVADKVRMRATSKITRRQNDSPVSTRTRPWKSSGIEFLGLRESLHA